MRGRGARIWWGPYAAAAILILSAALHQRVGIAVAAVAIVTWLISLPWPVAMWTSRSRRYPSAADRRAVRSILLHERRVFADAQLVREIRGVKRWPLVRSHRREEHTGVSLLLELPPRMTSAEASVALPRLAAALRLPFPSELAIEPELAHLVRLSIRTRNPLDMPRKYVPRKKGTES